MSRTNKIIWTLTEQSDWYAAFVAALQERKVQFPVHAGHLRDVMQAAREAVKVLKVERRREFTSIDSIRGDVAKRLIDNGIFPRDYLQSLRLKNKDGAAPTVDPRDEQIKEASLFIGMVADALGLPIKEGDKIADLKPLLLALQDRIRDTDMLRLRVEELEAQPQPIDLIKGFFSDIIADGLNKHARYGAPHGLDVTKLKESIPAFERERRRNPEGAASGGVNGKLPRFAFVGELNGQQRGLIIADLGAIAELRYADATAKLFALKEFNANGGRVILWANHATDDLQQQLKRTGVSYHTHRGTLPQLTEYVKGVCERLKVSS